jgi:hypothetical protein
VEALLLIVMEMVESMEMPTMKHTMTTTRCPIYLLTEGKARDLEIEVDTPV